MKGNNVNCCRCDAKFSVYSVCNVVSCYFMRRKKERRIECLSLSRYLFQIQNTLEICQCGGLQVFTVAVCIEWRACSRTYESYMIHGMDNNKIPEPFHSHIVSAIANKMSVACGLFPSEFICAAAASMTSHFSVLFHPFTSSSWKKKNTILLHKAQNAPHSMLLSFFIFCCPFVGRDDQTWTN